VQCRSPSFGAVAASPSLYNGASTRSSRIMISSRTMASSSSHGTNSGAPMNPSGVFLPPLVKQDPGRLRRQRPQTCNSLIHLLLLESDYMLPPLSGSDLMRVFPTNSPSGPPREHRRFEEQERAYFASQTSTSSGTSSRSETRSPPPHTHSNGYASSPTQREGSRAISTLSTTDQFPSDRSHSSTTSSVYDSGSQSGHSSTPSPSATNSGHSFGVLMPPTSGQQQRDDAAQLKFIALDKKSSGAPTRGPARWPRK